MKEMIKLGEMALVLAILGVLENGERKYLSTEDCFDYIESEVLQMKFEDEGEVADAFV